MNADADLAELPEDFARTGGLQRVDEQQHAGNGGDDGDRADSRRVTALRARFPH